MEEIDLHKNKKIERIVLHLDRFVQQDNNYNEQHALDPKCTKQNRIVFQYDPSTTWIESTLSRLWHE